MKTYQARFTILVVKKDDGWLVHPLITLPGDDDFFTDKYDIDVSTLDEVKPCIKTTLNTYVGALVDHEISFIEKSFIKKSETNPNGEITSIEYTVIATCVAPENSRFKDIGEIKEAVDQGLQVRWKSHAYEVIKDSVPQYLIKCNINNHWIELTNVEGNLLNGDIWDFYVAGEQGRCEMKPDWSKKPEWADVWLEVIGGHVDPWDHKYFGWFKEQKGFKYERPIDAVNWDTDEEGVRYIVHRPPETKPEHNIDWSKKPERAEVYIEHLAGNGSGWYASDQDMWVNVDNSRAFFYKKQPEDNRIKVHYPPKEVKPFWSGNGYPPVGIKARTSGGECRVLAVDRENEQVAIQWISNGELAVVNLTCVKPADLLREKWLNAAGDLLNNMQPLDDFLSLLYDAMILGEIPIPIPKKEQTNESTI